MDNKTVSNLNIRDIALRDNFTLAEKFNFAVIYLIFILITWYPFGRSTMFLGFIFILCLTSLFNLKVHEKVHPFLIDKLWLKSGVLISGPLIILVVYFATGNSSGLDYILNAGTDYWSLKEGYNILDTNLLWNTRWGQFTALFTLFALCTHLFIIPKSLYFINKLLGWCCINVGMIAIVGFLYKAAALKAPLFLESNGSDDFFFYFAYDGFWAAFAIMWVFISYALSVIEFEKGSIPFIETTAPIYITISILLASTALIVQANLPAAFLALSYSFICIQKIKFFSSKKDPIFKAIKPYCILLFIISFLFGIYRLILSYPESDEIMHLKNSALEIFYQSPIFGWGIDAFQLLAPFYNDVQLSDDYYELAPTGILSMLIEFGIFGTLIIALYASFMLIRYSILKQENLFSNTILMGLFALLILNFFETPFYNVPTLFSFWIIWFCAFRWADLLIKNPDEVDTGVQLLTDYKLRNIPYVAEPKKEVFK